MRGNLLRRRYLTPRSLFRTSNRLNELPAVRYIEFTINLIGRPNNDFFYMSKPTMARTAIILVHSWAQNKDFGIGVQTDL